MLAEIGIDLDKFQTVENNSYEGYSEMTSPGQLTTRRKEPNYEVVKKNENELNISEFGKQNIPLTHRAQLNLEALKSGKDMSTTDLSGRKTQESTRMTPHTQESVRGKTEGSSARMPSPDINTINTINTIEEEEGEVNLEVARNTLSAPTPVPEEEYSYYYDEEDDAADEEEKAVEKKKKTTKAK